MAKVFYDHLILIEDVLVEIDYLDLDLQEKQELKHMVDEMMHHQVLTHILDLLAKDLHEEFLEKFHAAPFDLTLLDYLQENTQADVKAELAILGKSIRQDLLKELKTHKRKK